MGSDQFVLYECPLRGCISFEVGDYPNTVRNPPVLCFASCTTVINWLNFFPSFVIIQKWFNPSAWGKVEAYFTFQDQIAASSFQDKAKVFSGIN